MSCFEASAGLPTSLLSRYLHNYKVGDTVQHSTRLICIRPKQLRPEPKTAQHLGLPRHRSCDVNLPRYVCSTAPAIPRRPGPSLQRADTTFHSPEHMPSRCAPSPTQYTLPVTRDTDSTAVAEPCTMSIFLIPYRRREEQTSWTVPGCHFWLLGLRDALSGDA